MFKRLLSIFLSFIVMFFSVSSSMAQEEMEAMTEPVVEINSFELFWPVVAGKTASDPLYFIKRLKEDVRGFLIFGAPEKADYMIFLTTKRIVEAEKLMQEDKKDLANKTLQSTSRNLQIVSEKLDQALKEGKPFSEISGNIIKQASNIELFSKWLKSKGSLDTGTLETIENSASRIKNKLQ